MNSVENALREFQGAWERAERPDLNSYLTRVPDAERALLARRVADWLESAPSPDYPDAVRAEIAAEPLLRAAIQGAEASRAPVATRLAAMRTRAGLAVGELAAQLTRSLGVEGEEQATTAYLEQLEQGELDERRLSRRLTHALAELVGARSDALEPMRSPTPAALFRADEAADAELAAEFQAVAEAALSRAPSESPMGEVDRLFRGGPDA